MGLPSPRLEVELGGAAAPPPNGHDAMVYALAHDLRGPLRTIDGFAELLNLDCGDALSEAGHQHLATIRSSAHRMRGLIDGLVEFTQWASAPLQPMEIDVERLVRQMSSELAVRYPELELHIEYGSLPPVEADYPMFRRLWAILIDNARKFAAKDRPLCLVCESDDGESGRVYSFRDNGVGIDSADVERVFDPYCRLHRYEDFPGAGMGLAIARRIVERHAGRLWAEGSLGKGTTISFTLGSSG